MRKHSFFPAPGDVPTFGWTPNTMGELFVDMISIPSIRLCAYLSTFQSETRKKLPGIAHMEDASPSGPRSMVPRQ